ncbi:hypothetical protein [Marinobacter halophilus]|uniref:hypothetical protein n=1 Tax=Marinobacter halophilus TaxID=1323740 RepID=UPI0022310575|nr:hypothetical protein [Marinobacter halophilus]
MSDLDVALPNGMGDEDYLHVVSNTLQKVLAMSRPDIVLYDAGVDVFQGAPLGKMSVSEPGIRERDYRVLSELKRLGIPVATVIGGG